MVGNPEVCDAKSALAFFRRSRFDIWGQPQSKEWWFRGQAVGKWPLVPSAWRPEKRPLFEKIYGQRSAYYDAMLPSWEKVGSKYHAFETCHASNLKEARLHRYAEHRIVQAFSKLASRNFSQPPWRLGDYSFLSDAHFLQKDHDWPDFHPAEIFLVAQHHGIPTRFLDWTADPLLGLAFVVFDEENLDKDGAMYAIRADELPKPRTSEHPTLQRHIADGSKNEFSFRQRSRHTYVQRGELYFIKHGRWPDHFDFARENNVETCMITIKKSWKRELAKLLWSEGADPARLTPNMDGVGSSALYWASVFPDQWLFDS